MFLSHVGMADGREFFPTPPYSSIFFTYCLDIHESDHLASSNSTYGPAFVLLSKICPNPKPGPPIHSRLTCSISSVNESRAIRIAEIMNDFTVLQRRIVDLMSPPFPPSPPSYSPSRAPPYGHLLLQQCAHDAQVILDADFATGICQTPSGAGTGGEQEKAQLQRQVLPSHPPLLSTVHPPIPVTPVAHSKLIS